MAVFIETPRFPDDLAIWGNGGPHYKTDVVEVNSGREIRNAVWTYPKSKWDFSSALRLNNDQPVTAYLAQYRLKLLRDYFHSMRGQLYGFRLKDFTDYADEGQGVLGTGVGAGVPTNQMYKNYVTGANTQQRIIQKPVGATITFLRNGAAIASGAGAGQYSSFDATTGLVTFVADASSAISSGTNANPTTVTLASPLAGLAVNGLLYISGTTGSASAILNNKAFTVTAIAGSTYTLAVDTSSGTWAGGTATKYAQPTDTLTWTGQFDVPARFDSDELPAKLDPEGIHSLGAVMVCEIRI